MPEVTVEQLRLFLVFVVPGFVAMKVYDLLVPSETRRLGDHLLEAIFYSLLNLGLMWWAVVLLGSPEIRENRPWLYYAGTSVVLVITPIALAVGGFWVRQHPWLTRWLQHPIPTGWDHFFAGRQSCWILFKLESGETFGGYFGQESLASAFPREPEVYVEQVWRVDDDGRFIEEVPRTLGSVVRLSRCRHIEFFREDEDVRQEAVEEEQA